MNKIRTGEPGKNEFVCLEKTAYKRSITETAGKCKQNKISLISCCNVASCVKIKSVTTNQKRAVAKGVFL